VRYVDAYLTPNFGSCSMVPIVPRGIVIHWPGVAGQRPPAIIEYWQERGDLNIQFPGFAWDAMGPAEREALLLQILREGKIAPRRGYGSANAIVDGVDVYRTIPWDREAFHAGDNYPNFAHEAIRLFGPNPNRGTVGIELCHPDSTGRPTGDTMMSAIEVCVSLCREHNWDPLERIWLHSHVTGKGTPWGIQTHEGPCHKWFYENQDEWAAFKATVAAEVEHAA
jgi:hypothetical protein